MLRPLVFVVLIGTALGLLTPTGRSEAPAAEARAAPPGADEPPRETRLQRRGNGHFYTTAWVDGQLVEFVVDTGASTIALTEEDAERIGIELDPGSYRVIGSGASGAVRGQMIRLGVVDIDGKRVRDIEAVVAEGLGQSLLGQSFLSPISSVEMAGEHIVLR